jgi:hypothetical protein
MQKAKGKMQISKCKIKNPAVQYSWAEINAKRILVFQETDTHHWIRHSGNSDFIITACYCEIISIH